MISMFVRTFIHTYIWNFVCFQYNKCTDKLYISAQKHTHTQIYKYLYIYIYIYIFIYRYIYKYAYFNTYFNNYLSNIVYLKFFLECIFYYFLRTKLGIMIYVLITNVEFVNIWICGIFTVLKCQFVVEKKSTLRTTK